MHPLNFVTVVLLVWVPNSGAILHKRVNQRKVSSLLRLLWASNLSPVIASPQHISPTLMIHPPSPNPTPPIPNSCPLTLCKRNQVNSICMVKRVLTVRIPILPCVSSTLKEVQRVVLKVLHVILCIQNYAAHHLYLESVIVIAVISITLPVLLGLII